jgi:hypothetical protein
MVMKERYLLTLSRTVARRERAPSAQGWLERVLERVNRYLSRDKKKSRE